MRMLDQDASKAVDPLLIMLTKSDAQILIGYLNDLLQKGVGSHVHFPEEPDYQREITLGLYDPQDLSCFSEQIKNLIRSQ